jgi:UDP-glucose 4-epimerase
MTCSNSPDSTADRVPDGSVLITGGCGFIGVNLVRRLASQGAPAIRILDNLSVGSTAALAEALSPLGAVQGNGNGGHGAVRWTIPNAEGRGSEVHLHVGDIRNRDDVRRAVEGVRSVVHLAAHAGVMPSIENPRHDCDMNVIGVLTVLEECARARVERVLFASSGAVLGGLDPPFHEGMVARPLSPYGASKLAGEAYCSAFYASHGLQTVALRFSNVYGPFSLHKSSAVARFIKDGLLRGAITIYGDGSKTRDFIHVEDLCSGICKLLALREPASDPPVWGQPVHLGSGIETSVLELARHVQRCFPTRVECAFEPEHRGEVTRSYCDLTRASAAFGFKPAIKLSDGISQVYRWFINQGVEKMSRTSTAVSGSE